MKATLSRDLGPVTCNLPRRHWGQVRLLGLPNPPAWNFGAFSIFYGKEWKAIE